LQHTRWAECMRCSQLAAAWHLGSCSLPENDVAEFYLVHCLQLNCPLV
jgi:hypothetical protein